MIPTEDIPLILLKERLELLAYTAVFTRDAELAEAVFRHVCEKALWRADGFESAAQLLECSRRTARERIGELQAAAGIPPVSLAEKTVAALESEWASRGEGTAAEHLEALGQCLTEISQIHFAAVARRHLEAESAAELAAHFSLTSSGTYRALAQSHEYLLESTGRKLAPPC